MLVSRQIQTTQALPNGQPWTDCLEKGSKIQPIIDMPTAEAISRAEKDGDRFVGVYPMKTYEEARRHELIEKIPGLVADMAEVKRLLQKQAETIELLAEEVNRKKRKREDKEKLALDESARKRVSLAASPALEPKELISMPFAKIISEATAAAVNAALAVVMKHSTVNADQ